MSTRFLMTALFTTLLLQCQNPSQPVKKGTARDGQGYSWSTKSKRWVFAFDYFFSEQSMYLKLERPDTTPRIFAPDLISHDTLSEFGSVFNQIGTEFYYGVDLGGRSEIRYTYFKNGEWTAPQVVLSDSIYGFNDPMLSPGDDRLYYISSLPRNEQDTIDDIDIWYSERLEDGWSPPINAGPSINSDQNEYYISFNSDGDMYFASNRGNAPERKHDFNIYKAEFSSGSFLVPALLSDSINTKRYEADVFIAPDESYIIFCSARKTGLGRGDLYISFRDKEDTWSKAVSMGPTINTEGHELCPYVSPDGEYFFYTSNQDIYWVSTELIDNLRPSDLK